MNIVFTPASLLEILNQIDELKEYNLSITETLDGNLQIQVGDSVYEIRTDEAEPIEVPEKVIDEVDDINEEAYTDLVETEGFEETEVQDVVESGLIKEAIKSMLLGGAIKLIKQLM